MIINKVDSTVLLTKEEAIIFFKILEHTCGDYLRGRGLLTEEELKLTYDIDIQFLELYLSTKNPVLEVNR